MRVGEHRCAHCDSRALFRSPLASQLRHDVRPVSVFAFQKVRPEIQLVTRAAPKSIDSIRRRKEATKSCTSAPSAHLCSAPLREGERPRAHRPSSRGRAALPRSRSQGEEAAHHAPPPPSTREKGDASCGRPAGPAFGGGGGRPRCPEAPGALELRAAAAREIEHDGRARDCSSRSGLAGRDMLHLWY